MARVSLLVAVFAALTVAATASAGLERSSAVHCSPSGDVCYAVTAPRGVVTFRLTLAARYFGRYRVCVKPPGAAARCKSFPVRPVGQQYGGSVRWDRNFPNSGPGLYTVTWKQGTTGRRALGPALTFRPPGPA
jgi:hypothetical protein